MFWRSDDESSPAELRLDPRMKASITKAGNAVATNQSPISAHPMPNQMSADEGGGRSSDDERSKLRATVSGKNQSARAATSSTTKPTIANTVMLQSTFGLPANTS